MYRRARHPAHRRTLGRGRQENPRLRHADLDRRRTADRKRNAEHQIPPFDGGAGYRRGHYRAGPRRYLFRPRRGDQPHRRPHQAAWPIRHAGAAQRRGQRHHRDSAADAAAERHRRRRKTMSHDGKRRRGLSYEDRVLWTTVTKAIKPLRARPLIAPDAHDDGEAARPPKPAPPAKRAAKAAPALAARTPPQPPAPPLAPLGRRMKQRVARGKESIDARLDLHGLTQHEAHGELLRFLRHANARDARLVLVITGKGRGGEIGVLRRQVPQWLGLPEFRSLVVGFEDAAIAHGGEGALYVRVRRSRSD